MHGRIGPLDDVSLEPLAADWSWLDALAGPQDADFVEATNEALSVQERAALDPLFD